MKKWHFSRDTQKASLLVVACWVLVFFSVLLVAVHNRAFMQMQLAQRLRSRGITHWLARAAAEYARAEQFYDATEYDSLAELQREREKQLDRSFYRYRLVDEESKLNINYASAEMLGRLPGLSDVSAENIITSELRPFVAIEQLSAVKGIGFPEYEQCKAWITVHGNGAVNINTAPAPVLRALGMDDSLIRGIYEYRAGVDGQEGTADDRVFEDTSTILAQLRGSAGLFAAQEMLVIQLISQQKLRVSSDVLTLWVAASVLGAPADHYRITIDRRGIRQWREL